MQLNKRSNDNLNGIHPYLVHVITEAAKSTPVEFTITDGLRTTDQQKALYAKGRTAPGPKVTNTDGVLKKSNHQKKTDGFGYAIDLYPSVNGKVDLVDKPNNLKKIASHVLSVASRLGITVEWGGSWKSIIDKPHFELKK